MTDTPASAFVRRDLAPQRPAPMVTTGLIGFVRTRLFNTPTNAVLTIVSALLFASVLVPTIRFLLVDAVWQGQDRNACLPEAIGRPVGACWPFIQAKLIQLIYGFYPAEARWRVNLIFLLAAALLLPLLIPRLPAKALNAGLFFLAFPVVAFFLLRGGGIAGFGFTWFADGALGLANSLVEAGRGLAALGEGQGTLGLIPLALGKALVLLGSVLAIPIMPLTWLREAIRATGQPVWADLVLTAIVVSALLFLLNGAFRTGWRALVVSAVTFACIGLVIAALGLDRGGLPVVDSRLYGGLLVTLIVSVTGIVGSMPIGIALALGRRASIPLVRVFAIAFIEFWRGVPLITVLFFATYMLPLFLPGNFTIDGLLRVLIGIALFAGAYNAEVIRGGLQAIPRGQAEAASALGLSYWKTTSLVVLPQALRHVIPGLVNSFIALFKDTTLVLIVAIFDLLGSLRAAFADPVWATPTTLFTGFAFTGIIYFVFCFGMSRYSLFVERRLNAHRRS
ncbi:amino acid ABC transporter permease [Bradyrhizobium sp. U87765 SZCCT0131]|uniref:amino acid ABC transporter permease n=1 Tax=unclassified Bradyrhizobium TaxID=2631580 RepID=UPI001BAB5119|nr:MULTISPECIES: amino acid ABC transporter permease [unclassified Bradyrhizobium]MBR1220264.1 amino acid ABC transporter permease [Bradyrhizobium sp. U87765 SZCCT0131]MBR1263281.1 amino acid ABC transporter permease [Bradyrhizobium sp. U87765 SZCCT0134]MBR1306836.1 amino acid ABC transporter permease [Bradyrhizobium sp. U87765 SZCCT0110]MBR1323335.1 amino acid ABC transporter permease [Bradyrhizobium sp. U87765 SZCCT0109]MBR1345790.1 amino acid ABC transporter permease [Bradyrhizobium sp. U87